MSTWTQAEIKEYSPVNYPQLQKLYDEQDIPITSPEKRADYLAHIVLGFTYGDELGTIILLEEKSKAEVLNHLEKIVIERYKRGEIILPS